MLKSIRKELLDEIALLSDRQLNTKPSEDTWSVAQVLRHLILLDEASLPSIKRAVEGNSERVAEKKLDFVLNRTNKVKSPLPEPSTEFITKEDLLKILDHSRTPLLALIDENRDGTDLENKSMEHPVFGPLSIKQMLEFISLHEKRHIEQMKEIKESIL
ncbi:MAG TPA: DinB family protein [Bacillota bacterium]|nr:DinB family protein [Bacillota bacterium]